MAVGPQESLEDTSYQASGNWGLHECHDRSSAARTHGHRPTSSWSWPWLDRSAWLIWLIWSLDYVMELNWSCGPWRWRRGAGLLQQEEGDIRGGHSSLARRAVQSDRGSNQGDRLMKQERGEQASIGYIVDDSVD